MAEKTALTMSLAQGRWSGSGLSQVSGDGCGSPKSLGSEISGAKNLRGPTCGPLMLVACLAPQLDCIESPCIQPCAASSP